jgi:hypothetical protein
MKKINFKFLIIAVCLIFTISLGTAFARSKSTGGFSSGRSFTSNKMFGSSSFSNSKSSWGKNQKSGLSGTTRKSSAGKMSSADRSLYNRAKSSGTVFNSRSDAMKSFKGKYGSQYPTKFASKPGKRPDYIPSSTTLKGKQYNVSYANGGYGYYAGSVWRPYSPFGDPFMAASLMGMHGYYYGPRPGLSVMSMLGMGFTLYALLVVLRSVAGGLGAGPRKFSSL